MLKKTILVAIGAYIVYVLIFGVFIFSFTIPNSSIDQLTYSDFLGTGTGPDRVALVAHRYQALEARVNLIEGASKSLDIAYHNIQQGEVADLLFAKIIKAADRGVRVRILVDGIVHSFRGSNKGNSYALTMHPNIDLSLYEPLCLLRPWRINNRLHDKLIIVDETIAMVGGRNIADKYFAPEDSNDVVNDRDVVIVNTHSDEGSVLPQLTNYFSTLWGHEYSRPFAGSLTPRQQRLGELQTTELKDLAQEFQQNNPGFAQDLDWLDISLPTQKISLIHNPIERLNKEPKVWLKLANLMENATESIYLQSPYVIPSSAMLSFIDLDQVTADITVLTNSPAASPNIPGISGYRRFRRQVVDFSTQVYEYQGPGSIHGKSYIIDGRISLMGSFNLDPRSTFLSTESMVVIDSQPFAKALKQDFHATMANSLKVGQDYQYIPNPDIHERNLPLLKDTLIRIGSLLARLFAHIL